MVRDIWRYTVRKIFDFIAIYYMAVYYMITVCKILIYKFTKRT